MNFNMFNMTLMFHHSLLMREITHHFVANDFDTGRPNKCLCENTYIICSKLEFGFFRQIEVSEIECKYTLTIFLASRKIPDQTWLRHVKQKKGKKGMK